MGGNGEQPGGWAAGWIQREVEEMENKEMGEVQVGMIDEGLRTEHGYGEQSADKATLALQLRSRRAERMGWEKGSDSVHHRVISNQITRPNLFPHQPQLSLLPAPADPSTCWGAWRCRKRDESSQKPLETAASVSVPWVLGQLPVGSRPGCLWVTSSRAAWDPEGLKVRGWAGRRP